jgi:NitT/TauT family transport system permease protein
VAVDAMTDVITDDTTVRQRPNEKKYRFNIEGLFAIVAILIAWQFASTQLPPILFPPLEEIATRFTKLLWDGSLIQTTGHTYLRIIIALAISFLISTMLGVAGGLNKSIDRIILPFVQIKQGVPSVCWIIFAILWFKDVEVRIAFIIVISTFPSLYYLARDDVRAIPADLWEMVRAWRPTKFQTICKLILPAISPNLITGLRVNIGAAARVTVFAELLGGVSGVGYRLRIAEEQFRMDDVLAWTVVLVVWILVSDKLLQMLEDRLLRSRGRKD